MFINNTRERQLWQSGCVYGREVHACMCMHGGDSVCSWGCAWVSVKEGVSVLGGHLYERE